MKTVSERGVQSRRGPKRRISRRKPTFSLWSRGRERWMRDGWKETEGSVGPPTAEAVCGETRETVDGIGFLNKGVFGTTGDSYARPCYLCNLHSPPQLHRAFFLSDEGTIRKRRGKRRNKQKEERNFKFAWKREQKVPVAKKHKCRCRKSPVLFESTVRW